MNKIPGCTLDDAAARVRKLTGFEVTDHRLLLQGLRVECRKVRSDERRREISLLE